MRIKEAPIEAAIKALERVLDVHENHVYPDDIVIFNEAINRLKAMQKDKFK